MTLWMRFKAVASVHVSGDGSDSSRSHAADCHGARGKEEEEAVVSDHRHRQTQGQSYLRRQLQKK